MTPVEVVDRLDKFIVGQVSPTCFHKKPSLCQELSGTVCAVSGSVRHIRRLFTFQSGINHCWIA